MNWTQLIRDCLDAGMTQTEIAVQIGASQSAVNHVLRQTKQKSFGYEKGRKLVALHRKVMRSRDKVAA
jgi:predicted transcriptional regulator